MNSFNITPFQHLIILLVNIGAGVFGLFVISLGLAEDFGGYSVFGSNFVSWFSFFSTIVSVLLFLYMATLKPHDRPPDAVSTKYVVPVVILFIGFIVIISLIRRDPISEITTIGLANLALFGAISRGLPFSELDARIANIEGVE